MNNSFIQKSGAISVFSGSILLSIYSVMVAYLMTIPNCKDDFCIIINHPLWTPGAITAFAGLLLLMTGFAIAYAKISVKSGPLGFTGIILLEAAYFFQAAKVTWEIFIYPLIAQNTNASFLIREEVLWNSRPITFFLIISTATILIGIVLFTVTLYKSKYYSKYSSILLLTGAVMYGAGDLVHAAIAISGIVIFSAGCFLIGLRLLRDK